ncbi:MAG TPA: chemotaxis protein CheA [Gemmatimonadaceae bacterium]|nr:chemotaxis protein CheA [Gemmatimonadaceae bacterium]
MTDGQFFEQFIDDYYAECEEHLAAVRRTLLTLESDPVESANQPMVNSLARALHTLKGLSGMVGLSSAERVAHAMEDGVRALPAADRPAHARIVEALFRGEALLEASIAARRAGVGAPDFEPYLDDIGDAIRPSAPASDAPAAGPIRIRSLSPETHQFEFNPTPDTVRRGIGVEMIRQRLLSLGEIVAVKPRVRPTGGVSFEFSVSIPPGVEPPSAWREDGLSWDWSTEDDEVTGGALVPRGAGPAAPLHAASLGSNVVRVDLTRLDEVMRMVGELVVTRSRVDQALSVAGDHAAHDVEGLRELSDRLEHQLRTLREGVMRIRLVAIGEIFERMRFAMRDIARDSGKSIRLRFEGQDTEIDKVVVDRMLEPLMHLVRNSASHGIESVSERVESGKPPEGTITLRARAAGDRIILEIEDDGAGIDIERVIRQARELGIATDRAAVDSDALLDLICAPGFSTRELADMSSGRGVGMAVVRSNIQSLGGELLVETRLGQGTRFIIELPLTLMIADALLVEVGDQPMAVPQLSLREILVLEGSAVTKLENNEVMTYRGGVLPLIDLQRFFNHAPAVHARRHVLVVGSDTQLTGLVVDRLIGLREIVVHPVVDPLIAVPGVAGATELADGRVSLILDTGALVRRTRERRRVSYATPTGQIPSAAGGLAS